MQITNQPQTPRGVSRLLFRAPIYLYRLGLGWVFGSRLLLLRHTGRRTGKPRSAVLEVVERTAATKTFVVASGWGPKASWYRNILENPNVTIQVGVRTMAVTALPLAPEEGAHIFTDYAARHRRAATRIVHVLGYRVDGSAADFAEVGRRLPFVRFVPRIDQSDNKIG